MPSNNVRLPLPIMRFFHTIVALMRRLVSAHESIRDEEVRQHAQLLSGILLTTIVTVSLIIALVVYFDADDIDNLRTLVGFSVIIASTLFFVVNRIGHTLWATFGFVAFLAVVIIATPYVGGFSEFVAFSVVPMLLVGMFYPYRWTVVFIASILIVVFVLNNINIDESIWDRRILWYFLLFAGALVLAFRSHLNRLEIIRRKKLDDANTHLQATLNAIPDMLLEVDYAGNIVDSRVPEDAVFPVAIDEHRGNTVRELLPDVPANIMMNAIEQAATTGKHTGSVFSIELGDEIHWFELSVSAKGMGDAAHADMRFVILVRDITERRQAEFLRSEQTRLEIDLEKEKELAGLRSELISIITHEFRTPLSVILTASWLLVEQGDGLSSQHRQDKVNAIVGQVKRLDALLDNVSTLSKSQRGFLQYNPQQVDIVAFCHQLVRELQVISQPDTRLVLEVESDFDPIQLDDNLLRHALTNLISNGIKYSPDDKPIMLKLARDESYLFLSVSDKGIGIPPDDMTRLFQPFYRASNVDNIQGTGLGLSIAKEAVDLHGGDITCESKPGSGTTFTIIIPINRQ